MAVTQHEVVITGIGLVSSLGEGVEDHLRQLAGEVPAQPVLEAERFAPALVHPLPAIDWSQQIERKGDLRQMDTWQRLGVYAAGLALADSDPERTESFRNAVDMIVAAGGGERDEAVDALVMQRARSVEEPRPLINELLMSELRPTLFLAQLSNLMAGNISIVHKVTNSSRTFMGEESAGISALQVAAARIAGGQGTACLVGGAFSAQRKDILVNYQLGGYLQTDQWQPVFSRSAPGGFVPGSVAAFLVLESAESAAARNATAYAKISFVAGDRGPRDEAATAARLDRMIRQSGIEDRDLMVLSGATGISQLTDTERTVLHKRLPHAAVRAYGNMLGHGMEAHFGAGVALAAAALSRGLALAPAAGGEERIVDFAPRRAMVTTVGHVRGEGICTLESMG
ncbi:beta-ketoacyl-ACP synthase [Aureimonas fodinaquatilis]|uniref:Beta-ketoacyl-ACP synthase n=1 Tax=Aureimonas fodinaquatilis TaxID=2565783 RepID=A0A5B0DZJ4_9HYPH|nr:beta-ketoacyl-ACP synthase [Aureimonas fodinaquatilis]KAA0971171.1 beta-ketoacyl-ACP synthase [Aureimonas fodinaquatilis]